MTCGIYKITNKTNGKAYIGASKNIEKRFNAHKQHSKEMSHIIKKQGIENFTFEILEECSIDNFHDKEREYIALYNTDKTGYNISKGGEYPHNSTGYYHVIKEYDDTTAQGYLWRYHYIEDDKSKKISRWNLIELKKEVLARGLKWKILNEEKAKKSDEENQKSLDKYNHPLPKPTGYYRVSKHKKKSHELGYVFEYRCTTKGNMFYMGSGSLRVLEQRVKCAGFEWKILNERIAKDNLQKNEADLKNINYGQFKNNTGVYRLHKHKQDDVQKGFTYLYTFKDNSSNKYKTLRSVDIYILKQKVLSKNLPWVVINEDQFKKILEADEIAKYKIETNELEKYSQSCVLRVTKVKNNNIPQGFYWTYNWRDENGKRILIKSTNLQKLQQKIENKGFPWEIINENQFKRILKEEEIAQHHKINDKKLDKYSQSGILNVTKRKAKYTIQGFYWVYNYNENGKRKDMASVSLIKLEQKVKDNGLPWKIIDEDKFKENIKIYNY